MNDDSGRALITTRAAFHDALRAGFAQVAEHGCRELCLVDPDYADWPLGERAVIEHLTRWAHAHRRLTVVAQTFDEVVRRHPRWVEWRRQWSHVVVCRTHTEFESGQMPTLLLAPGLLMVRLSDALHWRGVRTRDAADLLIAQESVDAILQRSAEAFPATTLGL